jgi:hypothetical protein
VNYNGRVSDLNHHRICLESLLHIAKMSDDEDDRMDIDIQFGTHSNEKGKRIARDLPVEAEDSLPWVEKYRPNTLDDVQGHQDILATINKFVELNVSFSDTPHESIFWGNLYTDSWYRGYHIFCYTARLGRERRRRYWLWRGRFMGRKICGKWFLN